MRIEENIKLSTSTSIYYVNLYLKVSWLKFAKIYQIYNKELTINSARDKLYILTIY